MQISGEVDRVDRIWWFELEFRRRLPLGIMSDSGESDRREDSAAAPVEMAPRWLSGGRSDVPLADNPTAIAYLVFVKKLGALFLKEQKARQAPAPDEPSEPPR